MSGLLWRSRLFAENRQKSAEGTSLSGLTMPETVLAV